MNMLLYNKPLLRTLAVLCGIGIGTTAWFYVTLSAQKLPEQGARDALAIVSFLVSGWLVMLIAEIIDNHYVRVFGCLCALLGGYISFPWIFLTDGPKLAELPSGVQGMRLVGLAFWTAMAFAVLMLVLLVWRLILDRITLGRPLVRIPQPEVSLGAAPPDAGQIAPQPALPPIPIDASPLQVANAPAPPVTAAPVRTPGSVRKLTGIGGLYLGTEFALAPGQYAIGRSECDLTLANDNQVSRRHAQITVDETGLATLADLGSTNGTFINNERVTALTLCPGDIIRIGTSLFKVEA